MDGGYNFGCGDSKGSGWSPWLGSTDDCYGTARYVLEHVPPSVKQVFTLNGGDVLTGSRFTADADGCGAGPVKDSYQIYTNYGSRPSWDLIAVHMAVYGEASLHASSTAVTVTANNAGSEVYGENTGTNQFQVWIADDSKGDATRVLDDMLCAAPCGAADGGAGCAGYSLHSARNCYGDRDGEGAHGATDLEEPASGSAPGSPMSLHACQQLCDATPGCEGVTTAHSGEGGLVDCFRKGSVDIGKCDLNYPSPFDTWTKSARTMGWLGRRRAAVV